MLRLRVSRHFVKQEYWAPWSRRSLTTAPAVNIWNPPSRETCEKLKWIDINADLLDPVFQGVYRQKQRHEGDLQELLLRSRSAGVKGIIIPGKNLQDSARALQLAKEHDLYATVGCHPSQALEFDRHPQGPDAYSRALERLVENNPEHAVAIGTCGIDYDRKYFSNGLAQRVHFRSMLKLAKRCHLPLTLRFRAGYPDFVRILREEGFGQDGGRGVGGRGGVICSFIGTEGQVAELMDMGFHISVNFGSFKTGADLRAVKAILLERLLLDTDSPGCPPANFYSSKKHMDTMPIPIRKVYFPPHAKLRAFIHGRPIKGRNEPSAIGGIAWVLHRVHKVPFEVIAENVWKNAVDLFKLKKLE